MLLAQLGCPRGQSRVARHLGGCELLDALAFAHGEIPFSTRRRVDRTYHSSRSQPKKRRPARNAASAVVPDPTNGSSTRSWGNESRWITRLGSSSGNAAGCPSHGFDSPGNAQAKLVQSSQSWCARSDGQPSGTPRPQDSPLYITSSISTGAIKLGELLESTEPRAVDLPSCASLQTPVQR